ncbi:MAG: hypothetical protein AAF433_21755 [Bacteroidota bacterium]
MKLHFFPDFSVRMVNLRPNEVRLLGNNHIRQLQLTYGIGTGLGILGSVAWLSSDLQDYLPELGILLLIAFIGFSMLASWVLFWNTYPKDYIKDEIQFTQEGIWVKVGMMSKSSGFLPLTYPLSIYRADRYFWFKNPHTEQLLFEFRLPQVERPDLFVQQLAKAMQLPFKEVVSDYSGTKYNLRHPEDQTEQGFSLSPHTSKKIYLSPNKMFSRLALEDGTIEYIIRAEYRPSTRRFQFFPNGKLRLIKRLFGGKSSQTEQLFFRQANLHRLETTQRFGDEDRPVLRCDLIQHQKTIPLFYLLGEYYANDTCQKLDVLEDIDVFIRDVENLLNRWFQKD